MRHVLITRRQAHVYNKFHPCLRCSALHHHRRPVKFTKIANGHKCTSYPSALQIHVSILDPSHTGPPREVFLAHLKSHKKMGQFRVECTNFCACDPQVVNGHTTRHSQTYLASLKVTPTEGHSGGNPCVLRVTVLPDTTSPDGGHKVKIMGVMISPPITGEMPIMTIDEI
jgi:hypothetical protein